MTQHPIDVSPRPLIFSDRQLVVTWAPKAACSFLVVWYFLKECLLPAADFYDPWPHKFRSNVYYESAVYKSRNSEVKSSNGGGFTLLRVTRNPAERMVSIFRHVCRYPFLHAELSRKLRVNPEQEGVSLKDLDRYLTGENLVVPSQVNFHLCAQYHPTWEMGFDRIVTLNADQTDLKLGLNEIENEFDLGLTAFDEVSDFEQLRDRHYAHEQPFLADLPIEEYRFKKEEAFNFPKAQLSRTETVHDMAWRHHAIDFGNVETHDTSGKLFHSI